MATRFLVINDPHVSDKPPEKRTESYPDDIMRKLKESMEIAQDYAVDFILFTGDLFHRFRGPTIQYREINRLLELLSAAPAPVFAIAGNHDLSYSGVRSVPDMPFGVLVTSRLVTWLNDVTWGKSLAGDRVLLIPRNWEPYIDTVPNIFRLKKHEREAVEEADYAVMVAHASILPPGETRPFPHYDADDLPTANLDLLLCGHIHEFLGIHKLKSGCWFANVGALSRDSATKHNLERTPHVLLVTLDNGVHLEAIPLESARPAEEVFIDTEIPTRVMGDIVQSLEENITLEDTPLEELIAMVTKDETQEVVDRLKVYLTEAEGNA